jgi:hypothetical protein
MGFEDEAQHHALLVPNKLMGIPVGTLALTLNRLLPSFGQPG